MSELIYKTLNADGTISVDDNPTAETDASIYLSAGSTAQAVPTGSTYTKFTGFSAKGVENGGMNADYTNNRIVVSKAGNYRVFANFSTRLGTADVTVDTAIFVDGVEVPDTHRQRKFSTTGYIFDVGLTGTAENVPEGGVIDVRAKHDNASSVNFTCSYASLQADFKGYPA